MNHSLPNFTSPLLRFLCLLALMPMSAAAQPEGGTETDGDRAVAAAARNVQAEPALSAELRYRIDAFGHELAGQGSYQQLAAGPDRRGPEKLLKLELKIQVADRAVTRQEICGPTHYYIRRELPFAPPSLGRVTLRQVRQAIARTEPAIGNPADVWIMLGGLPKLLESLHRNFDFAAPQSDELQFAGAGGQVERLNVVVVKGRWKPDRRTALLETDKGPSREEPDQLPDAVEIVLGRSDQVLPLFPYRITYWKQAKSDEAGQGREGGPLRAMLMLELFNVHRNERLDPRDFDYQPGDQEVAELTQSYLQRLGVGKTR